MRELSFSALRQLPTTILALSLFAAMAYAAGCSTPTEGVGNTVNALGENEDAGAGGDVCTTACTAANADGASARDVAVCYSCRCKAALGALPTPEELRCSTGEEIKVYKLQDDAEVEVTGDATDTECANPASLTAVPTSVACLPGSRLGQIEKGGSMFKFICRRKHHRNGSSNAVSEPRFDDFGIIGHNPATGATCFWDDTDGRLAAGGDADGEHIPDIDLTSGDAAKVDRFNSVFYDASAGSCTGCHDNDPFMFSPYLKSVDWKNPSRVRKGKYWRVGFDATPHALAQKHLTAPDARSCTSCHRIGQGNTCGRFAADSMGTKPSDRPYQAAVRGTADAPAFPRGFWMPEGFGHETLDLWSADFGRAKETIARCCAAGPSGSAEGCTWADLPGPGAP
jgi:hypothetical protein